MIKDKENCTLTVKISKAHLTPAAREEITSRRAVWGTDIYTDDSDVVAACIHAGWIRGAWTEDIDIGLLNLHEGMGFSAADKKGGKKGAAAAAAFAAEQPSPDVLTAPPRTGPVVVPADRDLHVTLVILPRLEKYASMTRFGIRSREFGGKVGTSSLGTGRPRAVHDGISFMVQTVRWVTNGAQPQNRLRGKGRRERIHRAMREINLGSSAGFFDFPRGNQNMAAGDKEGGKDGGGVQVGKVQWWKPRPAKEGSDGDKENRPAIAHDEVHTATAEGEKPTGDRAMVSEKDAGALKENAADKPDSMDTEKAPIP